MTEITNQTKLILGLILIFGSTVIIISCSSKSSAATEAISKISSSVSAEELVELTKMIKTEYQNLAEQGKQKEAEKLKEAFEIKIKNEVLDETFKIASDYCEDCTTNKGCLLNGCKEKCNWDAGDKCCKNENGKNCDR